MKRKRQKFKVGNEVWFRDDRMSRRMVVVVVHRSGAYDLAPAGSIVRTTASKMERTTD